MFVPLSGDLLFASAFLFVILWIMHTVITPFRLSNCRHHLCTRTRELNDRQRQLTELPPFPYRLVDLRMPHGERLFVLRRFGKRHCGATRESANDSG